MAGWFLPVRKKKSIFARPRKETPGIAAALGKDSKEYMNWIILIFAGLCECGFTFCLGKAKLAAGFWRLFFITTLIASIVGLKTLS